ncbi:twin-arginine translocase subunit TatC [Fulvivirga kasyanovii]|uniref:Sec-independent protein translocase protein TatC n=1 Tax=Fulvivirga kasyanovii TaxID=396812 RepID=A0ABW9RWQ2_9BACT|nr:twin-arginine translocase subunit TatC [Fulvivirga kasyanovii]MTI28136.1 twin-arginine translocase subunit TatC [Fulvivirga kasyanovii]
MSFIDHLEELRWHLIRSLIAIFAITIVAFISVDFVFNTVILGPAKPDFWTFRMLCKLGDLINSSALCIEDIPFKIQSRQMTGQFTMHITSSFVIGIIVAFPYAFWEFWRFISPGLHMNERSVSRGAVFSVTVLFTLGIMFGYYIMAPLSVNFLANYQVSELIYNEFDITSYVGTVTTLVLGSGILFQLPIVVYFLSKIGIVTPALMKAYRKHSIVVILILGAMLTPPDPLSQVLIALPLFGLYEFSILISSSVHRRQRKKELLEQKKYTQS